MKQNQPTDATHVDAEGTYYKPTGKTGNTWHPTYYKWMPKQKRWSKIGSEYLPSSTNEID